MMLISYAQNFEDVMLYRALHHVTSGFWIDVGACDPEEMSVTRAFSDLGWHGINIEANPVFHKRLVKERPNDINLNFAAGTSSTSVTLFDVEESGLTTVIPSLADTYRIKGYKVQECKVSSRSLASICLEHAPANIHFLKIDVEGAEKDVIASADFINFRPWILLIEATKPLSQDPSWSEWEEMLLTNNYKFAWFDGLNRFYIASEHWAELSPAFNTPPNVFDNFVRREYLPILSEREKIEALEQKLHDREQKLLHETQRAVDAEALADKLRESIKLSQKELDNALSFLAEEKRRREALLSSTSWKLTEPFRKAASLLPAPFRKLGYRTLKAIWWLVTPWRIPYRLRYLAQRRQRVDVAQFEADILSPKAEDIYIELKNALK